ncbi:MAG: hypothetical protein HUU04_06430 [Verrucomicrobiae bacterium]|nr:hypothetical protein [Verrucomicrobiae bacterium]
MDEKSENKAIAAIVREDPRYPAEAYELVVDALRAAAGKRRKSHRGPRIARLNAAGLLDAVRGFALDEYGPMTLTLLESWNVRACRDLGEVVFNLACRGVIALEADDRREDFLGGFDFEEAFRRPFEPERPIIVPARSRRRRLGFFWKA